MSSTATLWDRSMSRCSSPKSSPTGPTTWTSVKKRAASAKCTAEPPSIRSRSPNGVLTESKAMEPTTVSDTAGDARRASADGRFRSEMATAARAMRRHGEAAGPDFHSIGDYGFISDCHTGALVASDGTVEWMCLPRFDSPSVFAAILDRGAGAYRLGPRGLRAPVGRRYVPGTNVLETSWMTDTGWLVIHDALVLTTEHGVDPRDVHARELGPHDAAHMLVRTVECVHGEVELEVICEPAFGYATAPPTWRLVQHDGLAADATGGGEAVRLMGDIPLHVEDARAVGVIKVEAGDSRFSCLSWQEELSGPQSAVEAHERVQETVDVWRRWLERGSFPDHPWRWALHRSALVLKGLTYEPTGATVAALTTSLPETPGGERNWDYRYTWMRDTTFTLQALHYLRLDWEADEFMQYVADLEPNDGGALQIMYGIDGRRDLTESTRDDLSGYAGASPVRIGNGAFDQRQNDVFGAVLDSILLHTRRSQRLPRRLWPIVRAQAEGAMRVWREPDQGIWEARGEPQHYVSSKLMCWVAMDRAAKLAEIRGDKTLAGSWGATADEIKADILEHGVDARGVLRQHYATDALDASTLLAAIFGFLPGSDERMRASVLAIADELTENGFVLRYKTDETDDGLSGKEGTFLICSFWLVSALAYIGEMQRARDTMERLLRDASPLGLYAEELDTDTRRHLGNFPQAFSHLALIQAAARIILAERLAEYAR